MFLAAGATKLSQSKSKLAQNARMAWVNDFSQPTIKMIAVLEILGAIGLILPGITGTAEILTPLAALGLVLIMAGATIVHARRGEKTALCR